MIVLHIHIHIVPKHRMNSEGGAVIAPLCFRKLSMAESFHIRFSQKSEVLSIVHGTMCNGQRFRCFIVLSLDSAALPMQLGFGMRCERTLANDRRHTSAVVLIGNSAVVPTEVLPSFKRLQSSRLFSRFASVKFKKVSLKFEACR